jgi:hypothetical protein
MLIEEGFEIKKLDERSGVLQAETMSKYDFLMGGNHQKVWSIYLIEGKVIAQAKVVTITTNAFGAVISSGETYYSDASHSSHDWYWDIRKKIEEKCGEVIVDYKKEGKKRER